MPTSRTLTTALLLVLLFLTHAPTSAQDGPKQQIDGLYDVEFGLPGNAQNWYMKHANDSDRPTKSWPVTTVHSAPSENAPVIGKLTLETRWRHGNELDLVFVYHPAGTDSSVVWRDQLGDLFYDFHQFVLRRQENWVLLPPEPYGKAAWIPMQQTDDGPGLPGNINSLKNELVKFDSMPAVNVRSGDSTSIDAKVYFVTDIDSQRVTFRPELPSDMSCGDAADSSSPSPDAVPEYSVPLKQMVTNKGTSRFEVAYKRGC